MSAHEEIHAPRLWKTSFQMSLFLYQVVTQVWCKRNGLENSRGEQTSAEQFEPGAAIHLPLEGFQPVDVTFHRTVAERLL
jgi:hypothetical protein